LTQGIGGDTKGKGTLKAQGDETTGKPFVKKSDLGGKGKIRSIITATRAESALANHDIGLFNARNRKASESGTKDAVAKGERSAIMCRCQTRSGVNGKKREEKRVESGARMPRLNLNSKKAR